LDVQAESKISLIMLAMQKDAAKSLGTGVDSVGVVGDNAAVDVG
jgi:hypothetical protein